MTLSDLTYDEVEKLESVFLSAGLVERADECDLELNRRLMDVADATRNVIEVLELR